MCIGEIVLSIASKILSFNKIICYTFARILNQFNNTYEDQKDTGICFFYSILQR